MTRYAVVALFALIGGQAAAGGPVAVPDDPPVTPATVAPSSDWTGFYAGANLGFGDVNDGTNSFDRDFYGIQAGYLHDFGSVVAGAELAYSAGDFNAGGLNLDLESTRLKLIGGYDAGRVLPYLFVGVGDATISAGALSNSDSTTLYGLGAKLAVGATGRHVIGLEYLSERKDNFGGSGDDLDNREFALRYDFRF
ncbi:MAG: porin family protein [Tabrizicola sp.]|jgi:predicted porin|nr:porin family protein [Tabrizicola sp.]